jgi:hypothetical protein
MTNPYIFREIIIEDKGGSNPASYDLMLTETSTISLDYASTLVSDSQILGNSKSVELNIETYDDDILSDLRITTNASDIKDIANIRLQGVSGGMSLIVLDIRLHLVQKVGERPYYCIKGKKRGLFTTFSQYVWGTSSDVFGTSTKIWNVEDAEDPNVFILL